MSGARMPGVPITPTEASSRPHGPLRGLSGREGAEPHMPVPGSGWRPGAPNRGTPVGQEGSDRPEPLSRAGRHVAIRALIAIAAIGVTVTAAIHYTDRPHGVIGPITECEADDAAEGVCTRGTP